MFHLKTILFLLWQVTSTVCAPALQVAVGGWGLCSYVCSGFLLVAFGGSFTHNCCAESPSQWGEHHCMCMCRCRSELPWYDPWDLNTGIMKSGTKLRLGWGTFWRNIMLTSQVLLCGFGAALYVVPASPSSFWFKMHRSWIKGAVSDSCFLSLRLKYHNKINWKRHFCTWECKMLV